MHPVQEGRHGGPVEWTEDTEEWNYKHSVSILRHQALKDKFLRVRIKTYVFPTRELAVHFMKSWEVIDWARSSPPSGCSPGRSNLSLY